MVMGAGQGFANAFDVGIGINLVADLAAGANTGKRIHMRNYESVAVLLVKNAASAGTDDVVIQAKEANANTGGTLQNLGSTPITEYYTKSATTLAGTEAWVRTTQTADNKITIAGATYAAKQVMALFEVNANSLSDGFEWFEVDIADPGSGGTILGGVLYIPSGLRIARQGDLLAQPNA